MFNNQNKEINYVDFSSFNNEQNKLLEELMIAKLDLIIDFDKKKSKLKKNNKFLNEANCK